MAEQSPEKVARKEAKSAAFTTIKELVDLQKDAKYKEALATIRPSLYGIQRSGGGSNPMSKFIEVVTQKNQISEDEVFKKLKLGRKECAGYIRKHLRKVEPGARVWIHFDSNSGVYKLLGRGPKPPNGWTGYVPVEETQALK